MSIKINRFMVLVAFFMLAVAVLFPKPAESQVVRRVFRGVVQQPLQQCRPGMPCWQGSQTVIRQRIVTQPMLVTVPQLTFEPVRDQPSESSASGAMALDRPFVRTVRAATIEARAAGKINLMQQARIMAAVRLTRMGPEIESLAAMEMQLEPSATGLIDWENFDPEKFMVLIEAILKILMTFGIGA